MKQKKSIKLFIVFLIVYFIVGMGTGVCAIIYSAENHLNSIDLPPQSKLILGTISLVVFGPLLFLVCRYAKHERVKTIGVIAAALLVFISICVLSELLSLIRLG